MAEIIREEGIFAVFVAFLIFLVVNFDPGMATVFSLMIIADIIIFKNDKFVSYPFERTTKNRFNSLLESLLIFAGFLVLQSTILRLLTPSLVSTSQSIRTLLSLYATTTPALQGNVILTIIGFGIIVPFVETRFFNGRLFEIVTDFLRKRGIMGEPKLSDPNTWLVSAGIGIIFALYHLTARRCGSAATCQNAALLITFVFGTLSTLMVVHYKETKQATLLHVFANTIAVLFSLGLLGSILGA